MNGEYSVYVRYDQEDYEVNLAKLGLPTPASLDAIDRVTSQLSGIEEFLYNLGYNGRCPESFYIYIKHALHDKEHPLIFNNRDIFAITNEIRKNKMEGTKEQPLMVAKVNDLIRKMNHYAEDSEVYNSFYQHCSLVIPYEMNLININKELRTNYDGAGPDDYEISKNNGAIRNKVTSYSKFRNLYLPLYNFAVSIKEIDPYELELVSKDDFKQDTTDLDEQEIRLFLEQLDNEFILTEEVKKPILPEAMQLIYDNLGLDGLIETFYDELVNLSPEQQEYIGYNPATGRRIEK